MITLEWQSTLAAYSKLTYGMLYYDSKAYFSISGSEDESKDAFVV